MARYLTPRRIGLLAVIALYLDGHAAESSRLSILSFLASHIHLPTSQESSKIDHLFSSLGEDITSFFGELKQWASSGIPGRSVYDVFLGYLHTLQGIDSLHDFFETLHARLYPISAATGAQAPTMSRSSPLGQYIRRCYVEFTRLQFADLQGLWNSFLSYRAPTWEYWAQKQPEDAKKLIDEGIELASSQNSEFLPEQNGPYVASPVSTNDTETILTLSLHHLQKLGTRVPASMRSTLQQWIGGQSSDSGVQSLQHFLAFFEHWRSGQYTMALESLHRYFDYSLVAKSGGAEGNMRVYYQYALLHLSVLHADFECWDQSVEAMEECIATARENQDTACLNFALSWLQYLRQAAPRDGAHSFRGISGLASNGSGEQDEIAFLKAKAKEGRHWSLMSTTLLEEAKVEMYSSGSTNRSMEHIVQSAFLNVQHDLSTLTPVNRLFLGGFYGRIGQAQLATRTIETIKHVNSSDCPITDRVRAVCSTAYETAQEGRYNASLHMLQEQIPEAQGVLRLEQRVNGFIGLVQLLRSLHQDDLEAADYHYTQLHPLRSSSDPDLDFEIQLLEVDLFIRREELERALSVVNKRIATLKTHPSADIAQRLQFLVLKARIFAAGGQSAKGFSVALRAAATAERHRLVPVMLEALAALAIILNDISEFEAARDFVEAILPMSIDDRRLRLTAELFATLAESYVGIAGYCCKSEPGEQSTNMRRAEAHAERSREMYARLQDINGTLDALSMKAHLARWRHDETSAAQADGVYLQLLSDKMGNNTTL